MKIGSEIRNKRPEIVSLFIYIDIKSFPIDDIISVKHEFVSFKY